MNAKQNIYKFLRWDILTNKESLGNWKILIFVVILLLIMISSGHSANTKVIQISELNKKQRKLKAIYIDTNTTLTQLKLESTVRKNAKQKGLVVSKTPPKKIRVVVGGEL